MSGAPARGGRDAPGAALARAYHDQVVGPAVAARWPGLPHAAGCLGAGSDVLGHDDEVSRDHDRGLRLTLLVPAGMVASVDAHLAEGLPQAFAGHPVRFATTADPRVRHRVQVEDVATFVSGRTGLDASAPLTAADWLSPTGQSVLEATDPAARGG